ncbi:hypothetical protein FOMPIDRAFT_1050604 [Fomitopsis schrenkii]|uniref:Uncharacterized protein n=1 Tax=Fomitopsis schrenkii TaxID=2126942 RepID=S8E3G7_FOMSC|nr:hypothetical protein FOMPIDRAFT_1050604 [Fomitopsis schrenkii]
MSSSPPECTPPQPGDVVRLNLHDWLVLLETRTLDSQDVREGPWTVVAEAAVPDSGKIGFRIQSEVDVGVEHIVHREDIVRIDAGCGSSSPTVEKRGA